MAVRVTMKVFGNDDDALIIWSVPKPIDNCLGFAIQRRTYDPADPEMKTIARTNFLDNRIGFEDDPAAAPGRKEPSTVWPFQRFWWTDHEIDEGDIVSYRVVPMCGTPGALTQAEELASDWSPVRVLSAQPHSRFNVFFNRGFVISQFMARYLDRKKLKPKQFKEQIKQNDEDMIRKFLYGYLGPAMFNELGSAAHDGDHIFAALYELDDHQLIEALCTLGARAHVILGNGSVDVAGEDQNEAGRARLRDAGVDVTEVDRFTSPKGLAHNKFFVRTDATKTTLISVWTGSTNWTTTGLCTQLNNGLLIHDPNIGQLYMDQWNRLLESGSGWPKPLVQANSMPKPFDAPADDGAAKSTGTVWFSRTSRKADLKALELEIKSAKQGILFLMFKPGNKGVLPTVRAAAVDPTLYVRGVVSDLPGLPEGHEPQPGQDVDVEVIKDDNAQKLTGKIVQPEGIEHPVSRWALEEMTRGLFKSQIGNAIVHTKAMVIDPFDETPVVITGSHNFSENASTTNDENFIVVKGDRALAEAYAVHIMAAYDHYRYRAALQQDKGLSRTAAWMADKLEKDTPELRVWGVLPRELAGVGNPNP
jgi:phosphatidylserine/phosphatidylglycerophosphate/cardiolipin synthase-like enzyme